MTWARLPSVNDCVVTKQTCIVLCTFCLNFIVFISTLGFNNEGNCCQFQELEKSIKDKLLKAILRVKGSTFIFYQSRQLGKYIL